MPKVNSAPRTEVITGPIPHHGPDPSSSRPENTSSHASLDFTPPSAPAPPIPSNSTPITAPGVLTGNALRPDNGGTIGRPTQVTANFFRLKTLPTSKIFHYDVGITPEIPPQKARTIWETLSKEADFTNDHSRTVFDGRCNAFSVLELTSISEARTFKIDLMDGRGAKPGANVFTVKIVFVAVIDVRELQLFLDRRGPFTSNCATAIQALNIAATHKPFSNMVNLGRSVYSPSGAVDLGGGIEKWDGVFQSIRPGQRECFINIDTTATAFVKGGNAAEVIFQTLGTESRQPYSSNEILKLERALKGCVFTIDRGSSQRRYKITCLSEKGADKTMFDFYLANNEGLATAISVEKYFVQQYDRRLRYPSLPCLGAKGSKTTIYFPAELCYIVPGQHYKKKLNEDQVARMITCTAIKPHLREEKIRKSLRLLDFDNNTYLKAFGIQISSRMAIVPARVLPAPSIKFYDGQERPYMGSWQVRSRHLKSARLESWAILCFEREDRCPRAVIMNFTRRLSGILSNAGMAVGFSQPPIIYAQPHGDIGREIESVRRFAEHEFRRPLQLLMVLFPNKSAMYPVVKTYCETSQSGLMTQCATTKNVSRCNDQYCRMISLKINTKLGGVVSTLGSSSMPFISRTSTLVIGADVSHPSAGEDRSKPSIASVVASIDDMAAKFVGRVIVQDSRMEVIRNLQSLIKEIIKTYKHVTGHHPKRILFYRDGVSEGQFESILNTEVKSIKQAFMEFGNDYMPPLTFVVVKKRHHARFFPGRGEADRSGNCIPGTVVDTVITHPTEFAFYLQSHSGIQGTSRSTLYHVLLDENKFTSDSLQQLTFDLCHVYCRCPRSLSIVPAVQYAHLLAYRGRYYLDNGAVPVDNGQDQCMEPNPTPFGEIKVSEKIMNQMFFI
ncbi:hypothetical protein BGX21_009854 [Mortierella sp. AD011]|nr:hypothetical protein BGX21_009854 [Mortierella sp. AD011]